MVDFPHEAPFATRLGLVISSMLPSEIAVADFMRRSPDVVIESKAQDVAEAVGVARSTVIRACQTLGYTGYTQLRVALAREGTPVSDGETTAGPVGVVRARMMELGRAAKNMASVLSDEQLREAVTAIAGARRIVCAANGFSTAVAMDLAMRLAAMGLPAEFVADYVAQQFTAAHLTADDCCVIVSASGQNEATLRVAQIARDAGARIVVLCSFPRSPLAELADHTLIVVPPHGSFRSELEQTSRVAHAALAESLAALVVVQLGDEEIRRRRNRLIPVIGSNLVD